MPDLPHMTWLRAFEAAARHSSFTAAASELALTPAAVSQQIRLLEKHLNAQLFERLARGVELTDIGLAYAQAVRKSFLDMAVATDGLFGAKKKRVLRVRASISCAAMVIAPRLHEFHAAHPDIFVQLSASIWADRFDEADLEIDIRYGHGEWDDRDMQHLGLEYAVPVCSPAFAAGFGPDLTLQALAADRLVHIMGSEDMWLRLADHTGQTLEISADWAKVDSSVIALQMVMTGPGTTLVLERFARQYLDQGLVVAPLDVRVPSPKSHYLIVRDGMAGREDVSLFRQWVAGLYAV